MGVSSPARAAPSYSIDSFSEFSCFAVSRTPTTTVGVAPPAIGAMFEPRTTQEQDEELFRDLFAADNDWDFPAPQQPQRQHLSQKKAVLDQQKTPIWSTSGGGGDSPFLSAAFGSSPFSQASSVGGSVSNVEPPTLSAPVPRLNLTELINARPGDGSSSNVWGGSLCQLPEEADENEEGDDSAESEDRPESNTKSKSESTTSKLKLKASKLTSSSNNNNSKLHQETLSFLEKLDLKALLHTPRPDVLDFYPMGSTGGVAGAGVSATNQFASKSDDPRVENERDPVASICNAFNSSNTVKGKPTPGKASGKKHPSAPSAEISSRLSHMESTYGTTKSEPRKTRKGTIDRLANPILGYTSTLQALSPDQRRKREVINMDGDIGERGWIQSGVGSPVAAKIKRKDSREPREVPSSPLSHLATSAQLYEAASSLSSRRLQKKPAGQRRDASNNQLDDERDNNNNSQSLPVKRKPTSEKKKVQSLSTRKAALKKKIEEKQPERSNQSSNCPAPAGSSAIARSTFLTQHEEEEEKLNARVAKRGAPQFRRPSLPPPISNVPNTSEFSSRQPRHPVSVRDPKKQAPPSRQTQSSRRADSNRASDEREAKSSGKKSQSKAASVGKPTYREVQNKPKRPSGSRQQHTAPVATTTVGSTTAPRKPSNGELGKPSGRRPFPRANTDGSGAQAKADSSVTSVPKRKLSVGKASASSILLMGSTTASQQDSSSNNAGGATIRRGDSNGRQARKSQVFTPKKAPNNNNLTESATLKEKPTERTRRPPRETAATAKSSVVLPSIHPPKGKQSTERRNFVYRRTKPN